MRKNIPNMITCCNLICGCIAASAGFHHHFADAFLFILLGALFDFFDGLVARKLGVSGPMGIELDSLADVVTFGVAPGAMLFTIFSEVCYPDFMREVFWYTVMPFTAFLVPAFSAMRLAKFNIDERQHTTFIGMPTPANAIFWSALIFSSEAYLKSTMFNVIWLFLFMMAFCWMLVCEIPMFSLKFKSMRWEENKMRFTFLALTAVILIIFLVMGIAVDQTLIYIARGLAASIGLYVILCLVQSQCQR